MEQQRSQQDNPSKAKGNEPGGINVFASEQHKRTSQDDPPLQLTCPVRAHAFLPGEILLYNIGMVFPCQAFLFSPAVGVLRAFSPVILCPAVHSPLSAPLLPRPSPHSYLSQVFFPLFSFLPLQTGQLFS